MNVEDVRERLAQFLSSSVTVKRRGALDLISTPFAFPTGEVIELAVESQDDELIVSDLGITDGFLAERGVEWYAPLVRRAVDRLAAEQNVEIQDGVLSKRCRPDTVVSAVMAVIETAEAIAGATYTQLPGMPSMHESPARSRVRTQFGAIVRRAGCADQVEFDVVLKGKSGIEVKVTRVRDRPIIIMPHSLAQDPKKSAEAAAFELLDLRRDGLPPETKAACVYAVSSTAADGRLAEATRILEYDYDAGVFDVAEESRIARSLRAWIPPRPAASQGQLVHVRNG